LGDFFQRKRLVALLKLPCQDADGEKLFSSALVHFDKIILQTEWVAFEISVSAGRAAFRQADQIGDCLL
jgi:hypothetical protein